MVAMLLRCRLRKTKDQLKPSLAFVHMGRRLAADRGDDDLLHVGHVDAEAGDLLPVDVDREIGLAGDLFDLDIFDALDVLHQGARSPPPCRGAHRGRRPNSLMAHSVLMPEISSSTRS